MMVTHACIIVDLSPFIGKVIGCEEKELGQALQVYGNLQLADALTLFDFAAENTPY
jgi:hypothetical protein